MSLLSVVPAVLLDLPQALKLAHLVELEARWENLRTAPARTAAVRATSQDLNGIQKAYELFRDKLTTYNKQFAPTHQPEQLLNSPIRLALWCRRMRDLFAQVAAEPRVVCPVQLLEKGYRNADKLAERLSKEAPARGTPIADLGAAVQALAALGLWCDDLLSAAGTPSAFPLPHAQAS